MKQLLETKLFSVIKDFVSLKQQDLSTLENAYDEFVSAVFSERCNSLNMDAFYNSLCCVQVELKNLQGQTVKGEKKCPYATFEESNFAC